MNPDIDDDELVQARKVFFLDTNLSSPVLITEISETKNVIDAAVLRSTNIGMFYKTVDYTVRTKVSFLIKLAKVRKWTVKDLKTMASIDPGMYPMIESDMLRVTGRGSNTYYADAQRAAQELEDALCAGLTARGLPDAEIRGTSASFRCSESVPYATAYESFCNLYGRAESRVKLAPDTWTHGLIGRVDIWINSQNAILKCRDLLYYSSANQILMLKDKLASRYMMFEHAGPLGLNPRVRVHLRRLFVWQDRTLENYGNQAYNLLKATEPMFKTWLSHRTDNVFGNDTAYTRMISKMKEKEVSVRSATGVTSFDSIGLLCSLVESVTDTREIVEMFGCLKTCGHPLIDTEAGGLSAATAARTPDKTSIVDAQRLRNTFCHIVLTAYIAQHGIWPNLVHHNPQTTLRKLNDRQSRNLTRRMYDLSDWNTTEWTKLFDFDYFPNFLELMDDKSISLYKCDKHLTWDKSAGTPASARRLLLEIMDRHQIDIEEIVKRVSARDIPEDWLIVSLYPKEREFKLEPRMFAMLVLEMRCFFTCVEANLANSIFRYLPQQTMTKSKTQNQERLLRFTDPARNTSEYTLFLEIDLTRWNLKWRELVIHMIGHDMNNMFGVQGTFTVTHWFFSRAQMMVRVKGLRPPGIELPNPPESNLAWRNHLGGLEGLSQKKWTAATYAMIEMALSPLLDDGTISDYEVIGQGDNQVVRLAIPSHGLSREEKLPKIRDKVNILLEKTCSSVNQEVKPEENIESTSVLTYSKDVLVRGVEYPTSLKKHSRLFPVTSLDFPSVVSNCRAILAGAIAGGENALYPLRSAVIGHYHAYRYLRSAAAGFSIHGSDYPVMTHKQIQACLIIPSSINGMCGPSYASFFYKGGSDPLGKEISGLRFLATSNCDVGRLASSAIRGLEDGYMLDSEPNLLTLIDNPYALPISTPTSALSKVGQTTLEAFRASVKNKDIAPLLKDPVQRAEDRLKQDIIAVRPLNPILAHDLFEASCFGSIKLMRKMFVHTRTIQSVAQQRNPTITHKFLWADLNESKGFLSWLRGLPSAPYSGKDSYEICKSARMRWGVDLHGVSSYQPLDYSHYTGQARDTSNLLWSAHSFSDLLDQRGPLSGYLGTATREKRSEHGYKIVDTGAPSRSIMKLQLIRSQAFGNPGFNQLLDEISLTRSPVTLSKITDLLPKVIGGSISHRYSSTIREMAASYVGPLNFVTHIRVDTDNIANVSGSAFNYPVMLQEFIIMTQAGAKLNHLHRRSQSGGLHLPFSDLLPLQDDNLAADSPTFDHGRVPKSALSYSETLSVRRTYDSDVGSLPRSVIVSSLDYTKVTSIENALLFFFMETLRDSNRAKTIADNRGYSSLPSRYQLDIAEAHALGPGRLVNAIATAVALTNIRDTFRTLQLHPGRWDEGLFMKHNIAVCVKVCSSYLNHPLFFTHADSDSFRGSALRYNSRMSTSTRLAAAVTRRLSTIMSSPGDRFWSMQIPIFATQNSSVVVENLTLLAARAVRCCFTMGVPHAQEASRIMSGYMRVSKHESVDGRLTLENLRLRCTKLGAIYKRMGLHDLSDKFQQFSHLNGLAVHLDDSRLVLRNARLMRPATRERELKRATRGKIDDFVVSSHCMNCLPDPVSVNSAMWKRYSMRRNGGQSTAGYTWAPLLSHLSLSPTVLIIGNGNGGLADLVMSASDAAVIGVDLEKDMPRDSATLLHYLPIGVQSSNARRFLQSDWSINSSGDWSERGVREAILTDLPAPSTIIVDISCSVETLFSFTRDTLDHANVSRLYCRTIDESSAYKNAQIPHDFRVTSWCVSRGLDEIEMIWSISYIDVETHMCTQSSPCLTDVELPEDIHDLIPARWNELLESATLGTLSWNDDPLHIATEYMSRLCFSLLNKPRESQLLYKERHALMLGYATLLAASSSSPFETVATWLTDEVIDTEHFSYGVNNAARTHLLRYVPRLVSASRSRSILV